MGTSDEISKALADGVTDLVDAAAGKAPPRKRVERFRRTVEGLAVTRREVPSWNEVAIAIDDMYWARPAYVRALEAVGQLLAGGKREQLNWQASALLGAFLAAYFARVGRIGWNDRVFRGLFGELRRFLASDDHQYVYWVPLMGCRLAGGLSEVRLTNSACIRGVSARDLSEVWDAWAPGEVTAADLDFECALEVRIPTSGGRAPELTVAEALRKDLEIVLQLAAPCLIGLPIAWYRPDPEGGPFAVADAPHALQRRDWRGTHPERGLTIGKPLARRLPELIESYREASSSPAFVFACRRFSFVPERIGIEDQVIDCWIAFEALFLPDASGELAYRATMRIARFLGETPSERRKLRKLLAASYKLRSRIVHGVDLDFPGEARRLERVRLADQTRELVRRSLLRWTDPDAERDPTALDDALLA